jgi:hypothetical protein
MRLVFLDYDTKLFSCTTYDGDWKPYINDFATGNRDILNLQFGKVEGWLSVRGLKIKDFIANRQIQAHFCPYLVPPNRPEAAAS